MAANIKFNEVLDQSGLSMYALSKRSGVPYTTINEIHRGKNDINQCAAGTIWRLAAALGVDAGIIMNDIMFLDGVKGTYRACNYKWRTDVNSVLEFDCNGEIVRIDAGALYNIPSRLPYYDVIARLMIDDYLSRIQWDLEVKELEERRIHL